MISAVLSGDGIVLAALLFMIARDALIGVFQNPEEGGVGLLQAALPFLIGDGERIQLHPVKTLGKAKKRGIPFPANRIQDALHGLRDIGMTAPRLGQFLRAYVHIAQNTDHRFSVSHNGPHFIDLSLYRAEFSGHGDYTMPCAKVKGQTEGRIRRASR